MMHKYLIIDTAYEELIEAVEISEHQADAMMWLLDKCNVNNILFIRVDEADKPLKFKEI